MNSNNVHYMNLINNENTATLSFTIRIMNIIRFVYSRFYANDYRWQINDLMVASYQQREHNDFKLYHKNNEYNKICLQ